MCNIVFYKECDAEIEDDFAEEDQGPQYFAGPWTGCSTICGDGVKTREVTCYKKTEEGGIEVLEEGECSGTKPNIEEPCTNENSCEAADWILSDKSTCEGVCGLTHASMHAICADGTGQQVPEDEEERCDQDEERRPPTEMVTL